jgi:uncharacterized OB-fold protein
VSLRLFDDCSGTRRVQAAPGTYTQAGVNGEIQLVAQRCSDCGTRFFPARSRCSRCFSDKLEPVTLDRAGMVDCFTVVRQAPKGFAGPVPYVIGNVKVDGVTVLAHLVGKPVEDWRAGDAVASYVYAICPVSGGNKAVECYAFAPAQAADHQIAKEVS